jgi:glycosyltransferase involved in cell wall biosynthesis
MRMPRLLLITYNYPPRRGAGSIRPGGLAKYLPHFGWDVTVLTPELPPGSRPPARVIETEYQSVIAEWKSRFGMDPERLTHEQLHLPLSSKPNLERLHTRIIEYVRWLVAFPDEHRGWVPIAMRALSELNPMEKPDIILSSAPPASCHIIASWARQHFGRPWVADFRDLWTEGFSGSLRLLQPLHKRLEKKTLKTADALVTVSSPWARQLQQKYPTRPVYTITNGFDPDDFHSPPARSPGCFSITYAGYLYEGKRDPTLLFEVLHDLITEGVMRKEDTRVRFYGQPQSWLPLLVERYGLREIVEIGGVVPRQEALMRQAESQLLLLLGWSDPKETGQHTGKLFEYFGSARPILAVGGAVGVLTETLQETGAGVHISEKGKLRQYLVSAYAEFKSKGFVSYHADQAAISRYTHMEMARKFSEVLTATLQSGRFDNDSHLLPLQQKDSVEGVGSGCIHTSGR